MGRPNEDLGHCAPTGDVHHQLALLGISVNANFFDLLNAAGLENLLGPHAIGANSGGVHLDGLHGNFL
jgi:hypothetical protein